MNIINPQYKYMNISSLCNGTVTRNFLFLLLKKSLKSREDIGFLVPVADGRQCALIKSHGKK